MKSFVEPNGTEHQGDLWHVQVALGDVRAMTLDELDAAFQEGIIHENTYVRHDGAPQWSLLGQVIGDESDDDYPAHEATLGTSPVAANAQMALPVRTVPTAIVQTTPQLVAPQESLAPRSLGAAHSTAPMVAYVSSPDIDIANLRPRKRGVAFAVAALLLAAVGAVAFISLGRTIDLSAADVSRSKSTMPVSASLGAAAAPVVGSTVEAQPGRDGRLSDDQRRALLEADKLRVSKAKPPAPALPKRSRRRGRPPPSGSSVFHKGGNAHDPLNNSL
jgi:hypothetical protein